MGALTANRAGPGPAQPRGQGRDGADAPGTEAGLPRAEANGKVLVFEVAERLFAMELDRLEEIVADLVVTPTPQTPSFFLGLANLRGGVIPLLDARARLGCRAGRAGPATCFVLVRVDNRVIGLAVDRVRGIVEAGAACREALPDAPGLGLTAGFSREVFYAEQYRALVLRLDIDALCRFALPTPGGGASAGSRPIPAGGGLVRASCPAADGPGQRLFTFEASGVRFGLPLETLRRIGPYVAPAAPPHRLPGLLGYLGDNQRLTPVFDPTRLLHPAEAATAPGGRPRAILFLSLAGRPAGLAVERLGRIMAWPGPAGAPDPASPILDVVRDDGAGQPVFVLHLEALLAPGFLDGADGADAPGGGAGPETVADPDEGGASQAARSEAGAAVYVRFGLGDETMALPMDRLREVSPVEALTPVPRAPQAIVGLLNLRGTIIPAMDLRARLGLPRPGPDAAPADQSRILVVASGDQLCGLVVDRVYKPLGLRRDQLGPLPEACAPEAVRRFVLGVARVEAGQPMLLLDVDGVVGAARPEPRPTPARAPHLPDPREADHEDHA